jgi:hypothetical protein
MLDHVIQLRLRPEAQVGRTGIFVMLGARVDRMTEGK